ncbi:MAG: hypothetical protein FWF44_11555 [Defluviitaleaceae bacterium]|nr:hypothetical protein [Defluviitaleaceae bacterium]
MSLINEIKCARCDRKYSGMRSRCPYCGARRIGRGKYSEDGDNSKGKMLISVLIMSALVVAAGTLLLTTPVEADTNPGGSIVNQLPDIPDDNDTNSMENPITPPPSPPIVTLTPTPTPTLKVNSVTITFAGKKTEDFTEYVGKQVALGARVDPVGIEETIIWTSSDRGVFEVVATNTEGTAAMVTPIAKGTATLSVSVGDVEATCVVRIRTK